MFQSLLRYRFSSTTPSSLKRIITAVPNVYKTHALSLLPPKQHLQQRRRCHDWEGTLGGGGGGGGGGGSGEYDPIVYIKLARGAESNNSAEASNAPMAHQAQQSTYNQASDNVQVRGKNTFATPRNILALGHSRNKPKTEEQDDEKPKSIDEFRNMFRKD